MASTLVAIIVKRVALAEGELSPVTPCIASVLLLQGGGRGARRPVTFNPSIPALGSAGLEHEHGLTN